MSGRAHGIGGLPLILATALTSWVALWSWGGFVASNAVFVMPVIGGILLISAVGALARWARFPIVVVVAAQLLGALLFANLVWGSAPIPTGHSVNVAVQAFADSLQAMREYAAPVPRTVTEVAPVLVLGGMLCHLFVDLCAVTLARVPVAGLPLLIIYTLPVSILDTSVDWPIFTLTVGGFLVMLGLQEGARISRWGRQFGAPDEATEGISFLGGTDARRHPIALGATATALALFVPLLIPTLDLDVIGGNGPGGSGDREVRITNPMTDLRRDLEREQDIALLRIESPGPEPRYLRVSVLTTFTGQAWTPGNRDLKGDQTTEGKVPPPIGLSDDYPTTTRDWDISINDDLESWWLPTPMLVSTVEAGPDWGYDAEILDFYTTNQEKTTAGISYSLTELIPEIDGQQLSEAPPAPSSIRARYTDLPGVPDEVLELAKRITANDVSDYEKAQSLQNYFRSGEFLYTTEPDAGNGNDALVQFLNDKEGYCEQFASAMAVMARILDIPARVAVGFFEADKVPGSPGVFEYSSHDLHAWPELYFDGAGWVKFEPTPSTHIEDVPAYTRDRVNADDPGAEPSGGSKSAAPTRQPLPAEPTGALPDQQAKDSDGDNGSAVVPFLWGGGGLVLILGLGLTPRLLRRARTARRWRADADPAEVAWAELRDTTVDLGREWPAGRSPRATARALVQFFGATVADEADATERPRTGPETNPVAVDALDVLVAALEQARYAATPVESETADLHDRLDTCVAALRGGVTRQARWRAEWLPASVLSPGNALGGGFGASADGRSVDGGPGSLRCRQSGTLDQMS